MRRRQTLPPLWMMTDERQGDRLIPALQQLPRGAGVVFRHYALARSERRRLFRQVRAVARRRGLVLLLAGPPALARAWDADGSHGRHGKSKDERALRSAPAHNVPEIKAAERAGCDLVFISPAFETSSHPRVRPLGPLRFALLARHARVPVIALGGLTETRAQRLKHFIHGWGAIDALTR